MTLSMWRALSAALLLFTFLPCLAGSDAASPDCMVEFTKVPSDIETGKEYEIIMRLTNLGDDSLRTRGAFSGMHIEVENAHVKDVLAYAAFSGVRESEVKQENGVKWFEAAYNNLGSGETGSVSFRVIPRVLPVKIYYRAWIPADVTPNERDEAVSGLSDKYKETGYWRDERYLRRYPQNSDLLSPLCKVKVQAARKKRIDYRCYLKVLSSSDGLPDLDPASKKFLLDLARGTIKEGITTKRYLPVVPMPKDIPDTLEKQVNSVYVTLYNDGRVLGCHGSNIGDLVENTIAASLGILSDKRLVAFNDNGSPLDLAQATIAIDILGAEKELAGRSPEGKIGKIELGIDGVRIRENERSAFYKSGVAITSRMDHERLLETLSVKAGIDLSENSGKNVSLYKVPSIEFIDAQTSFGYFDLLRAAPYVELSEVTRSHIETAAVSGAEWLRRNQLPDGLYAYMYYPSSDHFSPENNIIRQAGVAYTMALMGRTKGDPSYTFSAKKAIDRILTELKFSGGEDEIPYLYGKDQNRGTLGGTALLLLSMVELEGHDGYKDLMKQLVSSILSMQESDGGFRTTFYPHDKNREYNISPAQAVLALIRYYSRVDSDPGCLNAVTKAFPFYSEYWDKKKTPDFMRWHTQAWTEAYFMTKDRRYSRFVFKMSDYLLTSLDSQYLPGNCPYPDYLGGISPDKKMPDFLTAAYLEGLCSSLLLARSLNDNERSDRYGSALALGARFILNLQFNSGNMHYVQNKPRADGAFRFSLTDNALRCDFTRHCIMALHRLAGHFTDEDFKKFTGQ